MQGIPLPVRHPLTSRGFTLLELLIVCLLISISLGLSIPSLRSSLISDDLASGARKVVSLVKAARAQAVTNQEAYLIYYDSGGHRLWYQRAEEEKTTAQDHAITLPPEISIERIQQTGGSSNQDPMDSGVWISREGYLDKTLIRLTDRENNSLNLLISPFLPTITISEEAIDSP